MPQLQIDLTAKSTAQLVEEMRRTAEFLWGGVLSKSTPGLLFQVTGYGEEQSLDFGEIPLRAPDECFLTAKVSGSDISTIIERLNEAAAAVERGVTISSGGGVEFSIEPPEAAEKAAREADRYQDRVAAWLLACFGPEISADRVERADRFLEEVFELLQAGGYDPDRVIALRDYVWSRPVGEPHQETGGVMVTLAAYCQAHDLDMDCAGEDELARVWTKVEKIRAKQAAKPTGSALPQHWSPKPASAPLADLRPMLAAAFDYQVTLCNQIRGLVEGIDMARNRLEIIAEDMAAGRCDGGLLAARHLIRAIPGIFLDASHRDGDAKSSFPPREPGAPVSNEYLGSICALYGEGELEHQMAAEILKYRAVASPSGS